MSEIPSRVQLRLVVDDAAAALDFYVAGLGGRELVRYAEPSGTIVHAEVKIGESVFSLTQADGEINRSPADLGGSAVLCHLQVPDADATAASMVAHGATVVIPVGDQYYGSRDGRLRDPFGHLWLLTQPLGELSPKEIQARVDAGAP
ncbi:MAG: VOC family protein [Geodermatophilaceae bacterium]|nr:VOC family protein [Geodermatophilaceae bacterium]MDQ3506047.1 VOC family protein [Actinomycetota bacterium]